MPQARPAQGGWKGSRVAASEPITARAEMMAARRAKATNRKFVLTGRMRMRGHMSNAS
jgi:hypothetical protein